MGLLKLFTSNNTENILKTLPIEKIIEFLKDYLDVEEEVWIVIEDSISSKELTDDPEKFNKSPERIEMITDLFKSSWEDNPEMTAGQLVSHYDITYRTDDFDLYRRMRNRRL